MVNSNNTLNHNTKKNHIGLLINRRMLEWGGSLSKMVFWSKYKSLKTELDYH